MYQCAKDSIYSEEVDTGQLVLDVHVIFIQYFDTSYTYLDYTKGAFTFIPVTVTLAMYIDSILGINYNTSVTIIDNVIVTTQSEFDANTYTEGVVGII